MSEGTTKSVAADRGTRHAALASALRRRILDALAAASGPLDAAGIAERFGIHVTTARFHLDQLEAAHLTRRQVQRGAGRGRPRVAYTAITEKPNDEALRELNAVLVDALTHDADGGRSRAYEAGTRWAQAYRDTLVDDPAAPSGTAAGSASREPASAPLVRVFEQLGFEPEEQVRDGQARIALNGCPFRDIAAQHPEIVCSAHRGLLDGSLDELGRSASGATLEPFVEPDLCMVRLQGADRDAD